MKTWTDKNGSSIRVLTREQVESENTVTIEERQVPFGYQNNHWLELLSEVQAGDEFWDVRSSPESWKKRMGRHYIALVRDGKEINKIIRLMN